MDRRSEEAQLRGASSATNAMDFTDAIHEDSKTTTANMGKEGEHRTGAFSSTGAVGSQFTSTGSIGGMAQKLGGPFDKTGWVGKEFTEEGKIGKTVQDTLGKPEE